MTMNSCNQIMQSVVPSLLNTEVSRKMSPLMHYAGITETDYLTDFGVINFDLTPMHEVSLAGMNEECCDPVLVTQRQGRMRCFYKCLKINEIEKLQLRISDTSLISTIIWKMYNIARFQMDKIIYDGFAGVTYNVLGGILNPAYGKTDIKQAPQVVDTFDANAIFALMERSLMINGGGEAILIAPPWAVAQMKKALFGQQGCCHSYQSIVNGFRANIMYGDVLVYCPPGLFDSLFPFEKDDTGDYVKGYLFFNGALQTNVCVGSKVWKTCCPDDVSIRPNMENSFLSARYMTSPQHKMGGHLFYSYLFAGTARVNPNLIMPVNFKIPAALKNSIILSDPIEDVTEIITGKSPELLEASLDTGTAIPTEKNKKGGK